MSLREQARKRSIRRPRVSGGSGGRSRGLRRFDRLLQGERLEERMVLAAGIVTTPSMVGYGAVGLPDGGIVVSGRTNTGEFLRDTALARYDQYGNLVPGFGTNGIVTTDLGGYSDVGLAVVNYPDTNGDKVVVAGYGVSELTANDLHFALARYNVADGSLDTSFGKSGIVITKLNVGGEAFHDVLPPRAADGKIVAVGHSHPVVKGKYLPKTITVARYTAAGSLDSTFGKGGIVALDASAWGSTTAYGEAGTWQFDGQKILVVGWSGGTSILARLNAEDGSLDPSFGTGGIVTTQIGGPTPMGAEGRSIATDAAGNIYVGGLVRDNLGQFAVFKYSPDGILDTRFGSNGWALPFGTANSHYGAESIVIQQNGTILVAGDLVNTENTSLAFAVALIDPNNGSNIIDPVTTDITSGNDYASALVVYNDNSFLAAGRGEEGTGVVALAKYGLSAGVLSLDTSFPGPSDPPPPPPLSLTINDVSQLEGNGGQINPTTPFTFDVTLSAKSDSPVTVSYQTENGSATTRNKDYVAASGTITIPVGLTTATITVNVIGDTTVEPDESFRVVLSNPVGAMLADALGSGKILNDDLKTTATSLSVTAAAIEATWIDESQPTSTSSPLSPLQPSAADAVLATQLPDPWQTVELSPKTSLQPFGNHSRRSPAQSAPVDTIDEALKAWEKITQADGLS